MKYVEVYKNNNEYATFPSILYLNETNEVIIVFRVAGEFSLKSSRAKNPTHHDNESKCCILISSDGGNSFNIKNTRVVTDLDDGINDPAISILSNGDLILRNTVVEVKKTSNKQEMYSQFLAHRPELGTVSGIVGLTIQISKDKGRNWSSPEKIVIKNSKNSTFVSREPIIELEDNTLLLSVYSSLPDRSDKSYIIRSWNNGISWQDVSLIAADKNGQNSIFHGISFNETAIINNGKGELVAMIRSDQNYHQDDDYMAIGGIGEFYSSFSYNAGFSWTIPKPTGVWGQPAQLIRLNKTTILCTYGYRKEPYSIRAVISYNNGISWDINNFITIKTGSDFWDFGYPSSCQRVDGKILTTYYWIDENNIRYIELAIWDLPEK